MWVTVGSGEGKGLSVRVEGERFLIGSGAEGQLMLGDPKVEPLHAYLQVDGDGHVEVHDLGSESGTFVGGERVDGSRTLHDGDEMKVGESVLIASLHDPAAELDAAAEPAPGVRVTAEDGEAVEVMPARERRRLREMSTAGLVAGGGAPPLLAGGVALLLVIVGGIVALSSGGGPSTAEIVNAARGRTVFVHARLGNGEST